MNHKNNLTTKEAATLLGVSVNRVRALIEQRVQPQIGFFTRNPSGINTYTIPVSMFENATGIKVLSDNNRKEMQNERTTSMEL